MQALDQVAAGGAAVAEQVLERRVEFGGGFGLEALQGVHLGLQGVQLGDDAALFGQGWEGDLRCENFTGV